MATEDDVSRQVIEPLWAEDFTFGVIQTALMRPGRGHSARGSNRKGWRYEHRSDELGRLSRQVTDLMEGLRTGRLTPEDARRAVAEGPHAGFILLADSKERMIECLAERFRAGDNVWVEGWTPRGEPGDRVLLLNCWHDPSHRRIV